MNEPLSPADWDRLSEIFEQLLESQDAEGVIAAVEEGELRQRLRSLWQHHNEAGSGGFLDKKPIFQPIEAFQPGQRLCDRFVIQHLLGAGGMGQVFLATDEKLNCRVALKTITPLLAELPIMKRRLLAEVQNARRVTHRNICRIYDYFEDAPGGFFAMEYLDGQTLEAVLKQRPSKPPEGRKWLFEIAEGLKAAHAEGILHGDLKPGNIIITAGQDSHAVITDFGLARALDDPALASGRQASIRGGSGDYTAPEIHAGGPVSVAADLYSFGKLAERLLPAERWWSAYLRPRPSDRPASLGVALQRLRPDASTRRNYLVAAVGLGGAALGATWKLRSAAANIPGGSLILVDEVRASNELTARAKSIRNAFLISLRQSPRLQLIPESEVLPLLKTVRSVVRATDQQIQSLLQNHSSGYWVESSLTESVGLLTWHVILRRTGDGLAILERRFGNSASPLQLAEAAALWIRNSSGESDDSLRKNGALVSEFTTKVPEALNCFAEGMEQYHIGNISDAQALLEEAVRLDPNFAQALAMLGMCHNINRNVALSIEFLERAYALSGRLPELEKSIIEANYFKMIEDPERMVEASRRNAKRLSYDPYYSRQLANLLCWTGQAEESIPAIRNAIQAAPTQQKLVGELLLNLCEANKLAEAAAEVQRAVAAGNTSSWFARGAEVVALCQEDYAGAAHWVAKMKSPSPSYECAPKFLSGAVEPAIAGWLIARNESQQHAEAVEEHEFGESMMGAYYLTDRPGLARRELSSLPRLTPCPPLARRLQGKIFWASRLQVPELVEASTASMEAIAAKWPNLFTLAMRSYGQGVLAKLHGDLEKAKPLLTRSVSSAYSVLTMMEAAELETMLKNYDLADAYWEKFERSRGTVLKLYFPGYLLYGWHKRMLLALLRSDASQAIRCRNLLVKHWGASMPQTSILRDTALVR